MSSVRELHNRAMGLVDQAVLEKAHGREESSRELFQQALTSELAAIAKLPENSGLGWSILHRSAATMALDCDDFRMAEKLVSTALAGDPHPEVESELRDVWERANFHRHLDLERVELSGIEVQLSLVGAAVAGGMTSLPDFLSRVDSFQKLIYRTAQRKLQKDYTSHLPREVKNGFRAFATAPRTGSFTIGIKLAHAGNQASFPKMLGTEEIVNELLDLLELANESQTDEIEARIPDLSYRLNFVGLGKKIAPDGTRVRQVGFTSVNGKGTRALSVTTPGSMFLSPQHDRDSDQRVITVDGILRFADANGRTIRIHQDNGVRHNVLVPPGLLDDIVRPLWNSHVTVRGTLRGRQKIIRLYDIWEFDPESDAKGTRQDTMYDTSGGLQQRLL